MAQKTYTALAPDGKTTLSITGPDNASKEQLGVAFQAAWDKTKPTEVTKPVDNVTPTYKEPANMAPIEHGLAQTFLDVSKNSLLGKPLGVAKAVKDYVTKSSLNDKLADLGSTVRTGASMAAGSALGLASGSPVVGSVGMATIDQALRKETGQDTGSSIFPGKTPEAYAGSALTGSIENEVMGQVLPLIGKVAGFAGKFPIGNRALELINLKPTLGQLIDSEGLENLFAKSSKLASVKDSSTRALGRLMQEVSTLTGKTNPSMETLSELHQAEISSAFRQFVNASNKEATNVIATAEIYPHQLTTTVNTPVQVPIPGSLTGQTNTVIQSTQVPGAIVKGPIWANNAIPKLVDIRKEIIPTYLSPDPDTPVANAIRGIFKDMNAKFDPNTGNLLSYDPMGFEAAWKNKQIIDKLGYGNTVENVNAVDGRFRSISKALNQDIDESIPKWSTDPAHQQTLNNANASWKKSKAIVNVRHTLYGPEGETGAGNVTFLNTKNAPDPITNTILYDHKKMKRFLKAGNYKMGNDIISSTNAKKDMQGYALQKMFYDNWKPDNVTNLNIGTLNGDKLTQDFVNYTRSKAGQNLFSKQQIAAYSDMFDAFKRISKSPSVGMSKYVNFNFGTRVAALAGPLLTGNLAFGNMGGIAVAGGEASLYGVARIMTNKQTAPLFNAFLHNRPLGMSFQAASRAMVQALSGQRLTLNLSDGTQQEGFVATDGKIRPIK